MGRPSGANYWGGNNSSFVTGAQKYFNDNDKPYFTDNDISYMKSSTMMRYQSGYNYAKRNYAEITEGLSKGEDVFYFVSHSMGGEFSEGMATYLIENGWNVNTMMHFNAWLPTEMYGTEGPIRVDLTTTDDIVQGLSIPVSGDRNIPNADYRIRKKSDKGFYFRHADLISNDEIWKGNQDWNSAMQTIRDLISTNPNIKIFVK